MPTAIRGISYGLDTRTLNTSYGDHFIGSSLNARWSRRNIIGADETYAAWGGSYLLATLLGGSVDKDYYQSTPAGNFEVQCKLIWADSGNSPIGPFIVDASGNGYMCAQQSDNAWYTWPLTSWLHTGASNAIAVGMHYTGARIGIKPIWMALNKTGTSYKSRVSIDGENWSAYNTGITDTLTPAYMGVGRIASNSVGFVAIDWFDVIQ
jgi:hypothetical protein